MHDDAWECFRLPTTHRRDRLDKIYLLMAYNFSFKLAKVGNKEQTVVFTRKKMSYTVAVMPRLREQQKKNKKNQKTYSDIMKKDLNLCILEKVYYRYKAKAYIS